ncbi:hypothetical protein [Pelagibius sp. Alg239-R121]|uniref:hypothetical protein n=1 Tax=Pelagibius sp. Alg239-R121 TaxID=2993448 RepID=UPI0024A61B78|nr:hypothetical protein [Pelagibius sp. Alg239-R121]
MAGEQLINPFKDPNFLEQSGGGSLPQSQPPRGAPTTTGQRTSAGRQLYQGENGEHYSEKSITVTHPSINGGQPTNIPSVFGGQILSEQEAIKRIAASGGRDPETGEVLRGYSSIDEAVAAARARSDGFGQEIRQRSGGLVNPFKDPAFLERTASRPMVAPVTPASQANAAPAPLPEADEGFLHRAANTIQEAGQSVQDAFTGDKTREFDLRELPQNIIRESGETIAPGADIALARGNPAGEAAIFQSRFPDAQVDFDAHGNPIGIFPDGRKFYLNRPGASLQDATQLIVEGTSALAGARLGGGAGSVAGKVGQLGGAAAGTAGQSIGLDVAARSQGSEQPIDLQRAGVEALFGAGGEIAASAVGMIFRKLLASPAYFNRATGELTERGRETLEEVGVDPDAASRQFLDRFEETANRATTPQQSLALAEAESLPSPVRLSQGDVTRDVTQQATEDALLKGVHGEGAKDVMQGFRANQQEALRGNVPGVQSRLSGGQPLVTAPGEGAGMATARLKAQAKAERAGVTAAYDKARASNAAVNVEDVGNLGKEMRQSMGDFDIGALPNATRALRTFESFQELAGGKITAVKVGAMEQWRKRLVNAIQGAERTNPTEAAALKRLRAQYDQFSDTALERGLITGDDAALDAWKNARDARRKVAQRFENDKIVKQLVDGDLSPEHALNTIFGAGKLGSKAASEKALQKMKSVLGPNSQEWKAMREEAFLKLVQNQDTGARGQDLAVLFSGDKYATALDTAMRNSPTLMKTLFTQSEIGLLQQLKRTALQATNRVPGAVNTSNSAHEFFRNGARRLFGGAYDLTAAVAKKAAGGIPGQAIASSATKGPRVPSRPTGIGGAIGALAGDENTYEPPAQQPTGALNSLQAAVSPPRSQNALRDLMQSRPEPVSKNAMREFVQPGGLSGSAVRNLGLTTPGGQAIGMKELRRMAKEAGQPAESMAVEMLAELHGLKVAGNSIVFDDGDRMTLQELAAEAKREKVSVSELIKSYQVEGFEEQDPPRVFRR